MATAEERGVRARRVEPIYPVRCRTADQCDPGQFCQTSDRACFEAGVCENKPHVGPLYFEPVCGCDGETYGNSCEAFTYGATVASRGACDTLLSP